MKLNANLTNAELKEAMRIADKELEHWGKFKGLLEDRLGVFRLVRRPERFCGLDNCSPCVDYKRILAK